MKPRLPPGISWVVRRTEFFEAVAPLGLTFADSSSGWFGRPLVGLDGAPLDEGTWPPPVKVSWFPGGGSDVLHLRWAPGRSDPCISLTVCAVPSTARQDARTFLLDSGLRAIAGWLLEFNSEGWAALPHSRLIRMKAAARHGESAFLIVDS